MRELIRDPANPDRFASVLVNISQLTDALGKSGSSDNPCTALVNNVTDIVFTEKELAESSGVTGKKNKDRHGEQLNPVKVEALKGWQ